jgi:hypothetical protein
MVLTHLILNGMIKVKGQLGEMAKCLEDPEPRIADLAKLFFKELSSKENAIYNNLPDGKSLSMRSHAYSFPLFLPVISHLSTGEHAVDEETFKSILKYIFTFIEKVSRPRANHLFSLLNHGTGKTSREHYRETLPAIPALRGCPAMAGCCVLSLTTPVQVGAVSQETHRRPAVLS